MFSPMHRQDFSPYRFIDILISLLAMNSRLYLYLISNFQFSSLQSTPPFSSFIGLPGLLMSKLLATTKRDDDSISRTGIGISVSALSTLSILMSCWALVGIITELSAIVPPTNSFISL